MSDLKLAKDRVTECSCDYCGHDWKCKLSDAQTMACPGCGDKPDVKPVTVPTFTQEMADAGTLPSVGMEAKHPDLNNPVRIVFISETEACFIDEYLTLTTCQLSEFKPLTPPIELMDKGLYLFDINNRTEIVGRAYFTDFGDCWMITDLAANRSYDASKCTNIQLLEVTK